MTDVSYFDRDRQFHEEWLGLAQPLEGLVFSVPVLVDAQIRPRVTAQLTALLESFVLERPGGPVITELRSFFRDFLGYNLPGMMVERSALDPSLSFYAPEGGQELRPSFALTRGPFVTPEAEDPFALFDPTPPPSQAASPAPSPWALVWDMRDDAPLADDAPPLSLDKPEERTGPWLYPPTAKFERLLRHTGIPIGLLCHGDELRLLYAPPREASAHLTFRLSTLRESGGRPVLAALHLLLHASRAYTSEPAHTLEGLLLESRHRQADVTHELALQVFEAVEILLQGFEQAADRDRIDERQNWLRAALDEGDQHLYQGVLSVVLRLVFLLYAEDQSLMPVEHPLYAQHLSVSGLYEQLRQDAGAHPESMHHRFGAYGRLLALFRATFLGVSHGDLSLPPRRGKLFDPASWPFLEGGLPGSSAAIVLPEQRAAVRPPSIDDGTLYRVLHRLIVFQGQRLSYQTLDVEQLGSVYESLMGYYVLKTDSPAVRVGPQAVWVELNALQTLSPTERKKLWKESCGLNTGPAESLERAIQEAGSDPTRLLEALSQLSPGRKTERSRHRVEAHRLVLQPGDERRRTGSHYTPRALTEGIVARTLEPILLSLGPTPTADQLLQLKLCDPAMGSGAFLVAACRQLADRVVAAWTAHGQLPAIAEAHADPHLHARRLVAQRCLYGVDKNPAAVELARLSLWLVTMSRTLPFTFVDHALRPGDSLVGLDYAQLQGFHWQPSPQLDFCHAALTDALEQAVSMRTEILSLAEQDAVVAQQEKRRLLDFSEQAMARVRLIADVCVGAFFDNGTQRERESERVRRMDLVRSWLEGHDALEPILQGLRDRVRQTQTPFHWGLEFPEVFFAGRKDPLAGGRAHAGARFDAIVGNPPFAGKNTIVEGNGPCYLDWLKTVHVDAHGNSDYSAHFFRRSAPLLGDHGAFGLIATNTIAQGDTRSTGLAWLVKEGWTIFDATNSLPWPGAAAVTVSVVHMAHGSAVHRVQGRLDGRPVSCINSMLKPSLERAEATALSSNAGGAFVGSYVLGMGFVLTPEERETLIHRDARNAERIFPYLGGQEVNTSPTQSFDRYVINFGQLSLEEASQWPELLKILEERVKPERLQTKDASVQRWWLFSRPRQELYAALKPLQRCLVTSAISKHRCFAFQPTNRIWSHNVYVFPVETFTFFAVLQSRIHTSWVELTASGLEDRGGYRPSDCFETFPFPQGDPRGVLEGLERVGERLYQSRAQYMQETEQGLTRTYNALKDPACVDERIRALRALHEALDKAVLEAYGWSDLTVPPFCPMSAEDTAAVQRFNDTVIDRLYALNAQRAQEEQKQAEKPEAKKGHKRPTKPKEGLGPLFGGK